MADTNALPEPAPRRRRLRRSVDGRSGRPTGSHRGGASPSRSDLPCADCQVPRAAEALGRVPRSAAGGSPAPRRIRCMTRGWTTASTSSSSLLASDENGTAGGRQSQLRGVRHASGIARAGIGDHSRTDADRHRGRDHESATTWRVLRRTLTPSRGARAKRQPNVTCRDLFG